MAWPCGEEVGWGMLACKSGRIQKKKARPSQRNEENCFTNQKCPSKKGLKINYFDIACHWKAYQQHSLFT